MNREFVNKQLLEAASHLIEAERCVIAAGQAEQDVGYKADINDMRKYVIEARKQVKCLVPSPLRKSC